MSVRFSQSGSTPSVQGASARSAATGGESVVRITGRNQIALKARNVQRIWLPTPLAVVNLSGATVAQPPSITLIQNLPPHTLALLLNVQINVNSGTSQNVQFHALASSGANFANAAGSYQHSPANTGVGQLVAPHINGGLRWQVAIGGTVNYDLTVNLVAVEVQ
jgi:hypothetical protein